MKSQVYIFQYMIFFVLGLVLFSSIAYFLSSTVSLSSIIISNSTKKVVSNNLLNNILDLVLGCKYCNFSSIRIYLPEKIEENFYEIVLNNTNKANPIFYFKILADLKEESLNVNNLNYTFNFSLYVNPKNLPSFFITYFPRNKTVLN
ncbi:MAG: hypothetical protein QXY70_03395 [Nanopusillaceae archaeon]